VNSRKRWQNIYTDENPFALPQAIVRELHTCCKQRSDEQCKYLWIHLPGTSEQASHESANEPLSPDDWMSVIDESASVGVRSVIISVGSPLHAVPQLVPICEWAQSNYEMVVGIHAYVALEAADADVLKKLNPKRTRMFADGEYMDAARFVEALGIPLYSADGLRDNTESPQCNLPSTMTCVGPEGSVYTCGLVLGQEQFRFGHVFERKLSSVMEDDSLPHAIPAGASQGTHRCNGCPPLMAKKMTEEPS